MEKTYNAYRAPSWYQRHIVYVAVLIAITILLYEEFVCDRRNYAKNGDNPYNQ